MHDREQVLEYLRTALPDLRQRWPIRSLALFGSVARAQAEPASDVDVLVEFGSPVSLSDYLALEEALARLLGSKVDLVCRAALKPYMRQQVLAEAVPL